MTELKLVLIDPIELGVGDFQWMAEDEIVFLCPFHNDDHPSLSLNLSRGIFHCWSCGERGRVKRLATKLGGIVSKKWIEPQNRTYTKELLKPMLSGKMAYDNWYLKSRKVENWQVEKWEIREHPEGIVVPLYAANEKLKSVLLRQIGGNERYKYFGEKPALFPLNHFRLAKGDLAIVEGFFGVLNAERQGVTAFATLGSHASSKALDYMETSNERQFTVVFDNDFAGMFGVGKILFRNFQNAKALLPGAEADEIDYWQEIMTGKRYTSNDYWEPIKYVSQSKKYKKQMTNHIKKNLTR